MVLSCRKGKYHDTQLIHSKVVEKTGGGKRAYDIYSRIGLDKE